MKPKMEIHQFCRYVSFVAAMSWIVFMLIGGCKNKAPIKVGFVGCLTGRLSDVGTAGRNGVMLAVEQVNQAGGINGRPIELIVKDDQNLADIAVQVDQELINAGVVAIIGHTTSGMSVAALPVINAAKIVMISPTSTSNDLTGLDDYFFRTGLPDKIQAEQLARFTFEEMGVKVLSIIYDLSNLAFTEGWQQNFTAAYEQQGGRILHTITFTTGQQVSYLDVTRQLLNLKPEGVLIVASAFDTALICQQMGKLVAAIPVISSGWAKTPELLQQGGSAVEGLVLPQTHNDESTDPAYLRFKQQFTERFGKEPSFAAAGGYESTQLLFQVLRHTASPDQLKDALLKQNVIQGLQGEITIDQYGDAQRKTFLIAVQDGKFVTIR